MMSRWCPRWEPRSRFGTSGRARAISTTSSETQKELTDLLGGLDRRRRGALWRNQFEQGPDRVVEEIVVILASRLGRISAAHVASGPSPHHRRSKSSIWASAPATVQPLGKTHNELARVEADDQRAESATLVTD